MTIPIDMLIPILLFAGIAFCTLGELTEAG